METGRERFEIEESRDRVTGALQYVDDVQLSGALYGAFVRLPCARARIKSVDSSKAMEDSEVVGVYTADDIFTADMPRYGVIAADQPILASGETKFHGDPVAIVLANSHDAARRGARKVVVDYEVLSPVLTAEAALEDGAPLVLDPEVRPQSELKDSNVMYEFRQSWGSVDGKESDCAVVLENTYRAPYIHHFAMEPYAAYAVPEDDGVTIVTAIQHPFQLRRIVATMMGLPMAKVRVRGMDQGGGFGGRGYPKIEPTAAYFAYHLKRPVKIALNAEEGFMVAQRESARVWIRSGFSAEGRIVFHDMVADLCVGAYTDVAPRVVGKTGMLAAGPYRTPNVRTLARGLFTHTAPTTAFRGFGAPHSGFAVESQINEAAQVLGIDPVDIRMRNLPERGEEIIPGETPVDGHWKQSLEKAAEAMEWTKPVAPGRGRGIALGIKNSVPATNSFARVRMNSDGSVIAYVGTTEMGQGSKTTMRKIVSRELGVPLESVGLVNGDTAMVPFDTLTASSRSTVTMGSALIDACNNLKKKISTMINSHRAGGHAEDAGSESGAQTEVVGFSGGVVTAGQDRYSLPELLAREFGPGIGEIEADGSFKGPKDPAHPLGGKTPFYEYLVTACEVSVDEETGEVTIHKLLTVSDVGKAINPKRVAGLDEGGAIMGLGFTMMEHLVLSPEGRIMNPSSLDYRIPTIYDIPTEMVSLTVENEDGPGPYGAKGMGEGGILAISPAVSQAIFDCTGVRIRAIPFSPEHVWRALQTQGDTALGEKAPAR
jgi:CO/xanthine dehydrogenase Mo-binding subunit